MGFLNVRLHVFNMLINIHCESFRKEDFKSGVFPPQKYLTRYFFIIKHIVGKVLCKI